jgi:hypothetical protein
MTEQSYPSVQNEPQSWANVSVEAQILNGPTVPFPDIKGVKWSVALEVGAQKRTDGSIKGFTRGAATPDGSIELYAGGTIAFIKALVAVAKANGYVDGGGAYQYGRVIFDIPILHTPLGETGIRKVKLIGCRIKKDGADGSEGVDADSNELELVVTRIERVIDGDKAVLL